MLGVIRCLVGCRRLVLWCRGRLRFRRVVGRSRLSRKMVMIRLLKIWLGRRGCLGLRIKIRLGRPFVARMKRIFGLRLVVWLSGMMFRRNRVPVSVLASVVFVRCCILRRGSWRLVARCLRRLVVGLMVRSWLRLLRLVRVYCLFLCRRLARLFRGRKRVLLSLAWLPLVGL